MQDVDYLEKLQQIKKQFLCNVPIKEINLSYFDNLNINFQEELIENTVRLDQILKYPTNLEYQKAFLKHILQYLVKQDSVIHDILYEEYGRLVALPCSNIYFKHYHIENGKKDIILKENVNLISDGTTGLRTWQASLALSEWIIADSSYFDSKVVLELGSGVGLTGVVLSTYTKAKTVYLTDCHTSVLTTLCDNVILNSSHADKNYNLNEQCLLEDCINNCLVRVFNLPWEDINKDLCQSLGHIDSIIAADVVYDKIIFEPLVNAVNCLFKYCGASEFILSCTERNPETLTEFLSLLGTNYTILNIEVPKQRHFLWPSAPPVKIFNVRF